MAQGSSVLDTLLTTAKPHQSKAKGPTKPEAKKDQPKVKQPLIESTPSTGRKPPVQEAKPTLYRASGWAQSDASKGASSSAPHQQGSDTSIAAVATGEPMISKADQHHLRAFHSQEEPSLAAKARPRKSRWEPVSPVASAADMGSMPALPEWVAHLRQGRIGPRTPPLPASSETSTLRSSSRCSDAEKAPSVHDYCQSTRVAPDTDSAHVDNVDHISEKRPPSTEESRTDRESEVKPTSSPEPGTPMQESIKRQPDRAAEKRPRTEDDGDMEEPTTPKRPAREATPPKMTSGRSQSEAGVNDDDQDAPCDAPNTPLDDPGWDESDDEVGEEDAPYSPSNSPILLCDLKNIKPPKRSRKDEKQQKLSAQVQEEAAPAHPRKKQEAQPEKKQEAHLPAEEEHKEPHSPKTHKPHRPIRSNQEPPKPLFNLRALKEKAKLLSKDRTSHEITVEGPSALIAHVRGDKATVAMAVTDRQSISEHQITEVVGAPTCTDTVPVEVSHVQAGDASPSPFSLADYLTGDVQRAHEKWSSRGPENSFTATVSGEQSHASQKPSLGLLASLKGKANSLLGSSSLVAPAPPSLSAPVVERTDGPSSMVAPAPPNISTVVDRDDIYSFDCPPAAGADADPASVEGDWADDDALQTSEVPEEQLCGLTLVSLDCIVASIMVQVTRPCR